MFYLILLLQLSVSGVVIQESYMEGTVYMIKENGGTNIKSIVIKGKNDNIIKLEGFSNCNLSDIELLSDIKISMSKRAVIAGNTVCQFH